MDPHETPEAKPRSTGEPAHADGGTGSDACTRGGADVRTCRDVATVCGAAGHAGGGGVGGGIAGQGGGGMGGGGDPVTVGCKANAGDAKCPEICAEVCNGKDDDCDGKTDEESPAPLCTRAHAQGVCNSGACLIVDCTGSYRDCDAEEKNGCETAEDDIENCGTCGHAC